MQGPVKTLGTPLQTWNPKKQQRPGGTFQAKQGRLLEKPELRLLSLRLWARGHRIPVLRKPVACHFLDGTHRLR